MVEQVRKLLEKRAGSAAELENLRQSILDKRDTNRACISVCGGTGCRASGAEAVVDAFLDEIERRELQIQVELKETGCHGFCERGPVVVIRPMYPRDAAISGIEGWVKVEFTITETGAVKDPQIVDAQPPRVFNREAIRAIMKWKFKPRVIDGVAVERRATQVIDFTLDDSRP